MSSHTQKSSGLSPAIDANIVNNFNSLTKDANIETLQHLISCANLRIISLTNSSKPVVTSAQLDSLFDYVPDLFDSVKTNAAGALLVEGQVSDPTASEQDFLSSLQDELDSLNLKSENTDQKVTTKWLMDPSTADNIHSLWHRGSPGNISQYPCICKVRDMINSLPQCVGTMNGFILNCFNNSSVRQRPHSDNEHYTDQSSSICTFSLGATRNFGIYTNDHKNPELLKTIELQSNSVSFMHPGSQSITKHRILPVDANSGTPGLRYSISFRHITPDKLPAQQNSSPQRDTTLIFGSSTPKKLDANKLAGKSNKHVINLARSGGKISDVCKDMDNFFKGSHEYFNSVSALKRDQMSVKNIIISVGTNDILNLNDSNKISRLYGPVQSMLRKAKYLFRCKVFIQSVIPIPGQRDDT